VQPYQQLYLADLLREHRERLVEIVAELAERGTPITELEARLLADSGSARLSEVENALRHDTRRRRRWWLQRIVARVRWWVHPRIGMLRHYRPKPLVLPASYFDTRPPDHAPTISIVTPSYEQGRFLGRTLYSVISQEYPALEYAVQDGGSLDETLDVLRRFEPALTRWTSEPDAGQADAINRGFEGTTGDIMAWLNSDDLLLPGSLAYVARYFSEHPDVDVVYGHRLMIDENDGQIGKWILPAHDDFTLTIADYVPQESLFWRRSIWEAAGGSVDASFAYALDWDLLLRFREAGAKMVRLPRFIGAFRIHSEQKTTATNEVGVVECNRLRERMHGRAVSIDEVLERQKPYLRRHLVAHRLHQLGDRFPTRRVQVYTMPPEPWLLMPDDVGLVDAEKPHLASKIELGPPAERDEKPDVARHVKDTFAANVATRKAVEPSPSKTEVSSTTEVF